MLRPWCWRRSSGPHGCLALAASALLFAAFPADAATLRENAISHRIRADGSVLESTRLRVHLETTADVDDWSTYRVHLDENRSLVEIDTYAVTPTGERVKVKKKDHDTIQPPRAGSLADSRRYRQVEFPRLPPGSELYISYTVREEPYHPSGLIALGEDDAIASLEVEVSGPPDLRFRLDGRAEGWGPDNFRLEAQPGRVRIVGEGLPAVEPPDLAPGDAAWGPTLRYAWDGQGSWEAVGRWYQGLLDGVGRSAEVAEQARRLSDGLTESREKLEALLAYTREKVRYVAVEIGIGGYRPSAPSETLGRGWGDCKDKSVLLVEMLEVAGIEAYPALILADTDRRIDREFPSFQFNHVIVAVPLDGQELAVGEGDPVAGGYLFLDPTDTMSSSRWLHAGVQDQDALVVAGERSALVPTPTLFELDLRELTVELALDPQGNATGETRLSLGGRYGSFLRRRVASEPADRMEARARSILGGLLPGAELSFISWGDETTSGPPRIVFTAQVELPALLRGEGDRRSLRLPGITGTPDLEALQEDRTAPVVLSPGTVHELWRLRLPADACPPEPKSWSATNDLGSFEQTVSAEVGATGREGTMLTVERRLELPRRWVEPDGVAALRELALGEIRARKRRLRFGDCGS